MDGKLDGQAALPASFTLRDFGTETWKLGIAEPGRWSADGAIDEVRIYNRALAAHEVRALAGRK